ncbi:MAG: ACP phosphodiesterase [Flavobacteriales bacterium]
MSNVERNVQQLVKHYTIGYGRGATVNNFGGVNYLAHFYLADGDEELTFGNYIGDGVRGSQLNQYSEGIQRGVRFHRFIDTFTDTHPVVKDAKALFYPTQSKFSPVVVDVLFDHVLAMQWDEHHQDSLRQFARSCYNLVGNMEHLMPLRSARFFQYMYEQNLLEGYATKAGVEKVFRGMDSRTKFESNMQTSIHELEDYKDEFVRHFQAFFPELKNECDQWRKTN